MNLRRFFSRSWPIIIGFVILAYFSYHALTGERGILKYWDIQEKIEEKDFTLLQLREKREVLQQKIKRLHPKSIDMDFLEEKAIEILNYFHPAHVLIVDGDTE